MLCNYTHTHTLMVCTSEIADEGYTVTAGLDETGTAVWSGVITNVKVVNPILWYRVSER